MQWSSFLALRDWRGRSVAASLQNRTTTPMALLTQSGPRLPTIIATQRFPLLGNVIVCRVRGSDRAIGSRCARGCPRRAATGAVIQVGPPFAEHLHTLPRVLVAGRELINFGGWKLA